MTRADWAGVCDDYRTAAGLFWPIPITLSVDAPTAESIRISDSIALTDPETDEPLATMRVIEKYTIDKPANARRCSTPPMPSTPACMVMQQPEVNLAGP